MTKKIVAIWAQDENGVIGKNQKLPWNLPKELKHFKETTLGQSILMGRVTFEGMGSRLLPGRENVILTQNPEISIEGALVFTRLPEVLKWYEEQEKTLYVIGGKQIFSLFEPYLDELIITTIHAEIEGDTYFPSEFNLSPYQEFSRQFYPKDEQNSYDFTIRHLKRKEL